MVQQIRMQINNGLLQDNLRRRSHILLLIRFCHHEFKFPPIVYISMLGPIMMGRLYSSKNYPYLLHRGTSEIPSGRGVFKAKILEGEGGGEGVQF